MKFFILIVVLLAGGILVYWFIPGYLALRNIEPSEENVRIADPMNENNVSNLPASATVAEHLDIPWDIAFLPDGDVLVTERSGTLRYLNPATGVQREIPIDAVKSDGEGGLLGVVLHPDFETNRWLYLYMTVTKAGAAETANDVVRYRFEDGTLAEPAVIVNDIPGALYHDGGRMAFGPDGLLYITTGDATDEQSAQDLNSLSGKILRVTDEGGIPADNPFGTAVYSYGHRNPQGLAWDEEGNLWATEHGRSGILSGYDEVNRIVKGGNYGWPNSEGDTVAADTIAPSAHSGADDTWAPASALYWDGSIFFGGLRGEALYEAVLEGGRVVEVKEHFKGEYGRIRTVMLGPDGAFYMTTSNRDGRGSPDASDDRIVRLNPAQFR